jgi:hypothetical protein
MDVKVDVNSQESEFSTTPSSLQRLAGRLNKNGAPKWLAAVIVIGVLGLEIYNATKKEGQIFADPVPVLIGGCNSIPIGGDARVNICDYGVHIRNYMKSNETLHGYKGVILTREQWHRMLGYISWINRNLN